MKTLRYALFTLSITLAAAFVAGCGSANNLAQYTLNGQKVLFEEIVKADAREVKFGKYNQYHQQEETSVLSAIAEIGSELLSMDVQSDLRNQISTVELVDAVNAEFANAMRTYLNTSKSASLDENPAFVATTVLEACSLLVSDKNTYVRVVAQSTITDRTTGGVVWQNREAQTLPVYPETYAGTNTNRTEQNILSAIQLAALEPEEVQLLIEDAADEVGILMAERLRKDVNEARSQ